MAGKLSHYDDGGRASMVDVSAKAVSKRTASASAFVLMTQRLFRQLLTQAM